MSYWMSLAWHMREMNSFAIENEYAYFELVFLHGLGQLRALINDCF